MPCEHDKDALIEVAASGGAPQAELRAHLAGCASCRAAFDDAQCLFSAIDLGVRAAVNAEVPSSLLPRVRAQLGKVEARRFRWVQPLVFASAGVALAFAVFSLAWPRHRAPANVAKQGVVIAPAPQPTSTTTNPEKASSEGTQIAAVHAAHFRGERNSTTPASMASSNPEVLVPPDEREGLAQLVATLNERRDVATALLALRIERKEGLVTVDPLEISDIEIKPLVSAETETPDGTGEKH